MKNQEKIWNELYKRGLNWRKETFNIPEFIKNKLVLELGVGNGKSLKSILDLNPRHVTAVDFSKEAIFKAKDLAKSNNVSYVTEDFIKTKIKNKFDVIFCYYFLNNFKENDRKKIVRNIVSMLNKKGVVLFEDFGAGDIRQKGKDIEHNTVEKQNGLICHFFTKKEVKELFSDFEVNIMEKNFSPIRKNRLIKRRIINAIIRAR